MFIAVVIKACTKCTYSVTQFNDSIFFTPNNVNRDDGNNPEKLQAVISFGMHAKTCTFKSNKTHSLTY